jgi:hypothetical protein
MTQLPPSTNPLDFDIGDLTGEDLACLGLRRANRSDFFAEIRSELHALATDCFAAARYCPSEAEEGVEHLAEMARLNGMGEADIRSALRGLDEADRSQTEQPGGSPKRVRRQRKPRVAPPDGLRTLAEAADRLGCSIKTLKGHVAAGALRYIAMGHGKKHVRRMFTDADLDNFIANQTRKDVPCPSTRTRARHTTNSTSSSEVIAFSARPSARRGREPKR